MSRIGLGCILIALAPILGACATITRGTTTKFVVESTPAGAKVKTSTGFTCPTTPCTFRMQRKDAFEVTVSKEGFASSVTKVQSRAAGSGAAGMAGNILLGGIIGMGVDATSGAMNDLTPNPLHVDLIPNEPATAPAQTQDPAKEALQ